MKAISAVLFCRSSEMFLIFSTHNVKMLSLLYISSYNSECWLLLNRLEDNASQQHISRQQCLGKCRAEGV